MKRYLFVNALVGCAMPAFAAEPPPPVGPDPIGAIIVAEEALIEEGGGAAATVVLPADDIQPTAATAPLANPSDTGAEAAVAPLAEPPAPPPLTAEQLLAANTAVLPTEPADPAQQSAFIVRLQVLLDRAGVSPGVIDGYGGENVAKAVAAFEAMRGLPVDGLPDPEMVAALEAAAPGDALVPVTLTAEDVAGPFFPALSTDYAELSQLPALGYRDGAEMLAERHHMDEDVLRQINPSATFSEGETVMVAAIGAPLETPVVRLVADKSIGRLLGYAADGSLAVSYPATIGAEDMPSPSGTHAVDAIATDAEYWYRPDVNFQQGDNTEALRLAPGPNNPIGSTWIGLDAPTYGIHGTPEPSRIDKTNSHGCVRLTNWDVEELVHLVEPGVPVEFVGEPQVAEAPAPAPAEETVAAAEPVAAPEAAVAAPALLTE